MATVRVDVTLGMENLYLDPAAENRVINRSKDSRIAEVRPRGQWERTDAGFIYVPRQKIAGAFAVTLPSKGFRSFDAWHAVRDRIVFSDFVTDQKEPSGTFLKRTTLPPESGMPLETSTKEFLGRCRVAPGGEYVGAPFLMTGQLQFARELYLLVQEGFTRAITLTGIGSLRQIGLGRGIVLNWNVVLCDFNALVEEQSPARYVGIDGLAKQVKSGDFPGSLNRARV